jgi:hypothetical protein
LVALVIQVKFFKGAILQGCIINIDTFFRHF